MSERHAVAVLLHGSTAPRLYGFTALRLYGFTALRFYRETIDLGDVVVKSLCRMAVGVWMGEAEQLYCLEWAGWRPE